MPHYQHGNDSGWDNATTFDPERVVETADLAAFLILQLRELAELAGDLGQRLSMRHRDVGQARWAAQARHWSQQADEVTAALLELWDGERFLARSAATGRTWGQRQPARPDADRAGRGAARAGPASGWPSASPAHLTAHGLATERLDRPHYRADGYWRGPIWAPATVLVE